jgi:hypothetical protein
MSIAAAPTKHATSANPTADFNGAAGGRREHDPLEADSNDNPMEYIDPKEWTNYVSRTFAECMHPTGTTAM